MSTERSRRTYDQYCGVAAALDVLGERWTLLIVRDLLPGPRRFGQLADQIPGISSDLLAARLRLLDEHGIVVRTEIGGIGGGVTYALTSTGEQLRPLIAELAKVGLSWLEPPIESSAQRNVAWALLTASLYTPASEVPIEPVVVSGSRDRFLLRQSREQIEISYITHDADTVEIVGDDDSLLAVLSGHVGLSASSVVIHGDRRIAKQWINAIRKHLPEPISPTRT